MSGRPAPLQISIHLPSRTFHGFFHGARRSCTSMLILSLLSRRWLFPSGRRQRLGRTLTRRELLKLAFDKGKAFRRRRDIQTHISPLDGDHSVWLLVSGQLSDADIQNISQSHQLIQTGDLFSPFPAPQGVSRHTYSLGKFRLAHTPNLPPLY